MRLKKTYSSREVAALTAYLANIAAITAAVAVTGDAGYWTELPSGSINANRLPAEQIYFSALKQVAAQVPVNPFADSWTAWGGVNGWNELDPLGFYNDSLHGTGAVGYPAVARLIFQTLIRS